MFFFFPPSLNHSTQHASRFRNKWLFSQSLHYKWAVYAFTELHVVVRESEPLLRVSSCSKSGLKVLLSDLWRDRARARSKRQEYSVCYNLLKNYKEGGLCTLLSFWIISFLSVNHSYSFSHFIFPHASAT